MRRLPVVFAMLFCCWAALAQQSTDSAAPAAKPATAQATVASPENTPKPAVQEAPTFWVPAPEERVCTWCDFRPVCGPRAEDRSSRKAQDRLADLEALRSMR